TVSEPAARTTAALDLAKLKLNPGDVVLVNAIARDGFRQEKPEVRDQRSEVGDQKSEVADQNADSTSSSHTARSAIRRLRVTSEVEFATQLRRQLAPVRQNAIRIEALQGELQDDVAEQGV